MSYGDQPAIPGDPGHLGGSEPAGPEVGEFRQGSPVSRWALARYLVGRAIGQSVSSALLLVALVVLGLAALIEWGAHQTFWAVLVAVVALAVLALRGLLRAVLRRLTATDRVGPLEARLRALVADTRGDVLAELRRLGLPGRTWTLPLLALRLLRRSRRGETLERLRGFQVDRVVPPARIDELHLIIRGQPPR
ncbi:MAG TPA: hypothetical protein VGH01_10860 [Jatrophihabitantaceae bacterium]